MRRHRRQVSPLLGAAIVALGYARIGVHVVHLDVHRGACAEHDGETRCSVPGRPSAEPSHRSTDACDSPCPICQFLAHLSASAPEATPPIPGLHPACDASPAAATDAAPSATLRLPSPRAPPIDATC